MRLFYCAQCGTQLTVTRKALPKFGMIADLVQYHECLEEPIEPNFEPNPVPTPTSADKQKFAQKLNELQPLPLPTQFDEEGLRDRRDIANVKSSAPMSLLDQIAGMKGDIPDD